MSTIVYHFFPDEVRRAALGGHRRAVFCQRRQHPGRIPHQWSQPLGGVRDRDEGASCARPQRNSHHIVPAKDASAQLDGYRCIGNIPVRSKHDRYRHSAQVSQ